MGSPISGFNGAPTLAPSLSSNVASPASTGLSGYAADLQNALNRSVGLAGAFRQGSGGGFGKQIMLTGRGR